MLYFNHRKEDCTGCCACLTICPKNCISFVSDNEGFFYPMADDNCIHCGKCKNVCPVFGMNFDNSGTFQKFAIAAIHNDYEIWRDSTSGGAFSGICEAYGDGAVIFGAKYENLNVVHDYVQSINDISVFRKSKYIQSDMKNVHYKIKDMLEQNKRVIFSGTPCQVAGVKNYLRKDYDNLLTIDLICHGVGSPGVFQEYIKDLEKKSRSKIVSFTFRNKKIKLGNLYEYAVVIELEDGRRIEEISNIFTNGFLQALFLRPSCGECKFSNINRVGDITIADLKKRYDLLPELKGIENLSAIIFNSKKGAAIYEKLKERMKIYKISIDDLLKTNNPLRTPSKMSEHREVFFSDLQSGKPIGSIIEKYTQKSTIVKSIWILIPEKVRSKIRKAIKWIRK